VDPSERGRRARLTAVLGVVYQACYAVAQLVCLGIIVRHQGPERYGLWMTVLALTTWVPLTSLGQTSALLTRLGPVALADPAAARRVFSASAAVTVIMAGVLALGLAAVGPWLPWGRLLNAEGPLTAPVAAATCLAGLAVALGTGPATLGSFAIYAHQRGDVVHLTMSAAALVGLGAVALAGHLGWPLAALGPLTLAGPVLGGLALWVVGGATGLIPRLVPATRADLAGALRTGLHFLALDVTTLILLRTPDVIVARLHGVAAVGPFASVGRLTALMLALYQAILYPLWPALGEAAARGDRAWVRATARRSLMMTVGLWAAGAVGMVVLGPWFIERWTGLARFADRPLILAAVGQTLGQGLLTWATVLLAGLSLQRHQVVATAVAAVVYLPLALLLGGRLGPIGVALAQVAALLLCGVPLAARALRRGLRR
jgi:O-antigen/teichoic acid export membrane protein